MKTILFIIPSELHGGTNKSLENLLLEIDSKFHILIYSIYRGGYYKDIFRKYTIRQGVLASLYFKNARFPTLIRDIDKTIFHSYIEKYIFKQEVRQIEKISNPDLLISFEEGLATRLSYHMDNIKKIAWVHSDFSQYCKATKANKLIEKEKYGKFDRIVCVSKATQNTMEGYFPDYKDRILYAYNTLNVDNVRFLSQDKIEDGVFKTSHFTIISVGRFDVVKRFDKIPEIVEKINKIKPDRQFVWYIIAPISNREKKLIEEELKRHHVEGFVVLLGRKDNPYPYIRLSNLLVCLSESESWSYVINEAKALHTPVVTTDFDAAYEVVDLNTGIITSIDRIHEIIGDLIDNKNQLYTKLKSATSANNYSNAIAVSQFNGIIDSLFK